MKRRTLASWGLTACMVVAIPAMPAASPLALSDVVEIALQHRPELEIRRIDEALTGARQQSIEGMLDPRMRARAGISEDQTPVASSFQPTRTRVAQLSAALDQPLASGDTLGLNLEYNRIQQTFNSPFAAQLASINPAYRSQLNLSLRHPLAKGANFPAYTEGMQASSAQLKAARAQCQATAYQLVLDAVNRFFALAQDKAQLRYAERAVDRAKRLVRYQKRREALGMIEKSARLQAEALLAARKTQWQQAQLQLELDRTRLNRFMLRPANAPLDIRLPALAPADGSALALSHALELALQRRPEVAVLDARIRAQESELHIAQDRNRMQLDVVAELGTRALAAQAGSAAASTFSINDRYAAVSVEWADSLHRHREKAAIQEAELTRQRLVAQRRQLVESIRDELARIRSMILSLSPVVALAKRQVALEKQKFDVEMERYRDGRSDTATLIQFEEDLHRAEQQWEIQRLNLQQASWQWRWAIGELMDWLPAPPSHGGPDR